MSLQNQNPQESRRLITILYQYSIGLCIPTWCQRNAENQPIDLMMNKIPDEDKKRDSIQKAVKKRDEALKRKVRYHFLNPLRKLKYRWVENGRICSIKMSLHLKNLIKILLHIILFGLFTTQVSGR